VTGLRHIDDMGRQSFRCGGLERVTSPDTDLIARAASGDAAAFQALVERHRSMVYRVAYQFAGNHHDAEDIAQDVFIKVYRSLDRFRYDAQLTSWLYRIVMNACIDHRRRQAPAGWAPFSADAELKMLNTPQDGPGPEDTAYGLQVGEVLEAEIARLPPGQRLVFTMRHHEGLKLSEIAEALGLAEGTVKRQLHAAVHRLRAALIASRLTVGGRA
jgi:RNA polymerase sigma-70 factor (ECF subfamily)